jgi:hypothetical protein
MRRKRRSMKSMIDECSLRRRRRRRRRRTSRKMK